MGLFDWTCKKKVEPEEGGYFVQVFLNHVYDLYEWSIITRGKKKRERTPKWKSLRK